MLVRWRRSIRHLKPTVHILVLAVGLFIAGLLDNIFSSATALSPLPRPVLIAGVLSSAIVGFCGVMIIRNIFYGLATTQNQWLHLPFIIPDAVRYLLSVAKLSNSWRDFRFNLRYPSDRSKNPVNYLSQPATTMVLEAYHTVVLATSNHRDIVEVAEALWDIVKPGLATKTIGGWTDAEKIIDTLFHLLSADCGQRANLICALSVAKIYGMFHSTSY